MTTLHNGDRQMRATTPTAVETVIRRATADDVMACHDVLWESVTDLGRRQATPLVGTAEEWWRSAESIHRFLAGHAAEWWVAESRNAARLVGYARSIERGGLLELTELFVRPGSQSRGLGRALLERAFPLSRGDVRSIIATSDVRALARYYAAGTVARFPILTIGGTPADARLDPRLTAAQLTPGASAAAAIGEVERVVLGFERGPAEVEWPLGDREGWVYRRAGEVVGFAFVGKADAGPIAALDRVDLLGILLHVEARAHGLGAERLDLEVPSVNETAVRHLLGRGFQIDPWINFLMSSRPFGMFDRFVGFGPPIFL
jgi:GNAT superfamily N-acetyltransferase